MDAAGISWPSPKWELLGCPFSSEEEADLLQVERELIQLRRDQYKQSKTTEDASSDDSSFCDIDISYKLFSPSWDQEHNSYFSEDTPGQTGKPTNTPGSFSDPQAEEQSGSHQKASTSSYRRQSTNDERKQSVQKEYSSDIDETPGADPEQFADEGVEDSIDNTPPGLFAESGVVPKLASVVRVASLAVSCLGFPPEQNVDPIPQGSDPSLAEKLDPEPVSGTVVASQTVSDPGFPPDQNADPSPQDRDPIPGARLAPESSPGTRVASPVVSGPGYHPNRNFDPILQGRDPILAARLARELASEAGVASRAVSGPGFHRSRSVDPRLQGRDPILAARLARAYTRAPFLKKRVHPHQQAHIVDFRPPWQPPLTNRAASEAAGSKLVRQSCRETDQSSRCPFGCTNSEQRSVAPEQRSVAPEQRSAVKSKDLTTASPTASPPHSPADSSSGTLSPTGPSGSSACSSCQSSSSCSCSDSDNPSALTGCVSVALPRAIVSQISRSVQVPSAVTTYQDSPAPAAPERANRGNNALLVFDRTLPVSRARSSDTMPRTQSHDSLIGPSKNPTRQSSSHDFRRREKQTKEMGRREKEKERREKEREKREEKREKEKEEREERKEKERRGREERERKREHEREERQKGAAGVVTQVTEPEEDDDTEHHGLIWRLVHTLAHLLFISLLILTVGSLGYGVSSLFARSTQEIIRTLQQGVTEASIHDLMFTVLSFLFFLFILVLTLLSAVMLIPALWVSLIEIVVCPWSVLSDYFLP